MAAAHGESKDATLPEDMSCQGFLCGCAWIFFCLENDKSSQTCVCGGGGRAKELLLLWVALRGMQCREEKTFSHDLPAAAATVHVQYSTVYRLR